MKQVWLHALVLLGVVLSACSPAAQPTTGGTGQGQTAPAVKRSENQVLRVAQTGVPASLSPEVSSTNLAFFSAIFDSLVTFGENFKIIPQVAEKWEFKNGIWTFTIRKDLVFTNGTPLTAEDVAFSLNNIVEKKTPQTTYLGNLKAARAIDATTLEVTTLSPDATLLNGMPWAFVFPKAYYNQIGDKEFAVKAIGSGPYEVADYRASTYAKFKKKAAKHPFREVIATELNFQAVPEQSAIVAGLRTGDIDLTAHVSFNVDNVELLQKDGVGVLVQKATNVVALLPQVENKTRNTPLTDKRVRQALNYAVDRDALAKTIYKGQAEAISQLSLPGSEMFITDLKPYTYDPAMAKRLLAEAGYPNGFKLPVGIDYAPTAINDQVPLAYQSYLKQIGIEADLNAYEIGTFLDKFYGRNGQTRGDIMFWASGDYDGVSASYRGRLACDGPVSGIWWCNEEFVKLFDASRNELDVKKRSEMVQKAHKIILDDVAFVPFIVVPLYVMYGKKIQGVEFPTGLVFRFDTAYRVD